MQRNVPLLPNLLFPGMTVAVLSLAQVPTEVCTLDALLFGCALVCQNWLYYLHWIRTSCPRSIGYTYTSINVMGRWAIVYTLLRNSGRLCMRQGARGAARTITRNVSCTASLSPRAAGHNLPKPLSFLSANENSQTLHVGKLGPVNHSGMIHVALLRQCAPENGCFRARKLRHC
jgi:hypothetical protein